MLFKKLVRFTLITSALLSFQITFADPVTINCYSCLPKEKVCHRHEKCNLDSIQPVTLMSDSKQHAAKHATAFFRSGSKVICQKVPTSLCKSPGSSR